MREKGTGYLFPDREEMSDTERRLFLSDIEKVCREYFECGNLSLEITRSEEGFIVCVLFPARRIKNAKSVR